MDQLAVSSQSGGEALGDHFQKQESSIEGWKAALLQRLDSLEKAHRQAEARIDFLQKQDNNLFARFQEMETAQRFAEIELGRFTGSGKSNPRVRKASSVTLLGDNDPRVNFQKALPALPSDGIPATSSQTSDIDPNDLPSGPILQELHPISSARKQRKRRSKSISDVSSDDPILNISRKTGVRVVMRRKTADNGRLVVSSDQQRADLPSLGSQS